MKSLAHLKTKNYLLKLIAVALVGGYTMRYGMQHSVTFADIVITIASTPLLMIVFIELLDKFSDKLDYQRYAQVIMAQAGIKNSTTWHTPILSFLIALVAYVATYWMLTGSILVFNGLNPAAAIVGAIYALYIIAPETGDDELIFFLWLAATVATGGSYLTIFGSLGVLSKIYILGN